MISINLEKHRYKRKFFYINLKAVPKDILTMISLLGNIIVSVTNLTGAS